MGSQQVATFHGYVHSTRDALLIFEAVRRGQLPKITRRLRDDERKLIQSGTIFVFDEVESSIKRWTDGMIWSPSRILNNFLVYREVEKKDPKPSQDQPAFSTSHSAFSMQGAAVNGSGSQMTAAHAGVRSVPLTLMPNAMEGGGQMVQYKQEHAGYHSLDVASTSANPIYGEHDGFFGNHPHQHHAAQSQAAGMVGFLDDGSASNAQSKREAELDRTIVGSLTSSYPFVRDGLCKKTISIQVEGSTQHLISYYKIDDVHHQRLTVPSSLPEIASLSISPIFLNKSNFRYPPLTEIGPDGMPRYVGEATDNSMRTPGHVSSGNESYSSGSEARHNGMGRPASRSISMYSSGQPVDPLGVELYAQRYPHQIGGDGMLPTSATPPASYRSRRSSDAPRRRANSRYEPYQHAANFGSGMVTSYPYPHSPAVENGPVSPSGRRTFFGPPRGYVEADPTHGSEYSALSMARPDSGFFAMGQVGQAGGQNGGGHMGQMDQQQPLVDHMDQHMNAQQSFPAATMMPMVPSQPARNYVAYAADMVTKQEQADPFHFSAARLTRGSWDSNQQSQTNSFVHHIQQPPATSQGLAPVSAHSQASFGGPTYGRLAGSPPNTSSSHDSRHSYVGSIAAHAPPRIEELADDVHPPQANQLEEASFGSRPISRAGDGYLGELDSAGMVQTGAAEGMQGHSGASSPYPRTVRHPHAPQLGSYDNGAVDSSYGRSAGVMDGQPAFYQQQSSLNEHGSSEQEYGRHAQGEYTSMQSYAPNSLSGGPPAHSGHGWSSDPVQDMSNQADAHQDYSSRPATSHDQGYHRQYRDDLGANEAGEANVTADSGLERVMLTRPAS